MRLLVDTHALLWWLTGDPRLKSEVQSLIGDPENEVHLSAASFWEASIKRALGRLRFETAEITFALASGGFRELPVKALHAIAAGDLPRHHDDPFDRMLVAQAAAEGLTLITHDKAFEPYGVSVVWT